eukprot:14236762-Alexandrium_andersonii.AAC.1
MEYVHMRFTGDLQHRPVEHNQTTVAGDLSAQARGKTVAHCQDTLMLLCVMCGSAVGQIIA